MKGKRHVQYLVSIHAFTYVEFVFQLREIEAKVESEIMKKRQILLQKEEALRYSFCL